MIVLLMGCKAYAAEALPTCACDAYARPFTATGIVRDYLPRYGIAYIKLEPILKEGTRCRLPVTRLRVSKKAGAFYTGDIIRARYQMQCAGEPVVPGGFDYDGWLAARGMAAIGFAFGLPERLGHTGTPLDRFLRHLEQWREAVAGFIHANAGYTPASAVAIALVNGDQQYIDEPTLEAMRASGLAHLLSISGLHMALIGGLAYAVIRQGAALTGLAERYPTGKIAAVVGWLVCLLYLGISGAAVPAVRSFIMASVVFLAILTDRRAISLWTLGLAAVVVLSLNPKAVFEASFQLSFMATATLIVYYKWRQQSALPETPPPLWQKPLRYQWELLHSGVWVFLTTAPIVVLHFQRLAVMSPLANLAAIPLTGFIVMPFLLASVVLWPLGLGGYPMAVALWGIDATLFTAHAAVRYGHDSIPLPSLPNPMFLMMMVGIALLGIVRHYYKLLPALGVIVLVVWWLRQPLPTLLLTPSGDTLAYYDAEAKHLWLIQKRRRRFEVEVLTNFYANPPRITRKNWDAPAPLPLVWTCTPACTITLEGFPSLTYDAGGWEYKDGEGWQRFYFATPLADQTSIN